ncbi:hypothetical protein FB639_003899 [Coemansia asiatica]|nr:hypothetical protein FB639_003899 [Coemansia asiatica]
MWKQISAQCISVIRAATSQLQTQHKATATKNSAIKAEAPASAKQLPKPAEPAMPLKKVGGAPMKDIFQKGQKDSTVAAIDKPKTTAVSTQKLFDPEAQGLEKYILTMLRDTLVQSKLGQRVLSRSLRARSTTAFANFQQQVWAVRSLVRLVECSLEEDRYGVVQGDIENILETLFAYLAALERCLLSPDSGSSSVKAFNVQTAARQPLMMAQVVRNSIYILTTSFYHSYDRILNFVLFKVVSVRATLDADWEDLAIWTVAYCCFGALYLVGGLARDHLEGLRLSPAHPDIRWGFVGLLCALIVSSLGMGALSWMYLRPLFSILCIEALTILFDVGQTLTKYVAYAWDGSTTNSSTESWEARSDAVLLCEFATDICILVLTLLHYMHILVINGLTLNIVSALVFFNIRSIASKLYRKTRKLAAFQNAISSMKCRFPDATKEDIVRFDDRCSICREVLVTAKKLPCDHLFHRSCLRSWLVRHLSCPTCRITLSGEEVGQWASSNSPITDTLEHGSDLVFATANTT